MKAVSYKPFPEEAQRIIRADMDLKMLVTENEYVFTRTEEEVIADIGDANVLFMGYDRITEKVMCQAPNLQLICSERDGPEENIDIAAATKLGIPVVHCNGRCVNTVADHTMMLMLVLSRSFPRMMHCLYNGYWDEGKPELLNTMYQTDVFELANKTLGIVGMGRNGQAVAKRAAGFGMHIVAYDPYCNQQMVEQMGVHLVTLMELMKQSDYVVVLARATKENHGMVGREQIAAMKETAFLINTGRAALIDNDALYEAVVNQRIKGAALDVFEKEPLPLSDRLVNASFGPHGVSGFILTPHLAGLSNERDTNTWHLMLQAVDAFLRGKLSDGLINPDVVQQPMFAQRGAKLFGIKTE